MKEPCTLSELIAHLYKIGYTENFQGSNFGLRAVSSDDYFPPESLLVDKFFRLEGETDLDEETIIFALSCPKKSIKGTYLVAFGPKMDPLDAQIVKRLEKKKNQF